MRPAPDANPPSAPPLTPPMPGLALCCALFCRVIDNFGDAGVCWRLARQLAREHGWQVSLFIDAPAVLQAFLPTDTRFRDDAIATPAAMAAMAAMAATATTAQRALATVDGVDILPWPGMTAAGIPRADGIVWPPTEDPGDVVIEAFACDLPEPVQHAMAARATTPIWINLEYLSAEDWVSDCHLMPSRHPRLGLEKTFFFPGVRPKTGGVLRESDLTAQRQSFLQDPDAQAALWARLGLARPAPDQLLLTLFAYENPGIDALLAAWSDPAGLSAHDVAYPWRGITVLVPQGRISPQVAHFFGRDTLAAGDTLQRGALTVQAISFVTQTDYDRLLWIADLNFVRGEDSFVRAQWAERPFIWHIYPQEDAAHLPKLEAALNSYIDGAALPAPAADALRAIWRRWNAVAAVDAADAVDAAANAALWRQLWQDTLRQLGSLREGAATWAVCLQVPGDLAGNLVRFCAEKRV